MRSAAQPHLRAGAATPSTASRDAALATARADALTGAVGLPIKSLRSRRARCAIRSISICRSGASCSATTARSHSIAFRERLESMRLIEEFMVLANVAAAETLEKARMPLIYRIHEQPSTGEAVRVLRLSAHHQHQSFAKGQVIKPGIVQPHPVDRPRAAPHEKVMNDVVLRTQAQAIYSPGQCRPFRPEPAALCAFHLADPPLRRPVVHRALIRALQARRRTA